MQRAYMSKLMELAEKDSNILHLVADSDTGFDELFARYFPMQIYNFGIAEEHMVAASAGMATVNKIPFVYTTGAFLVYRSLEFIRDDICFQNLNVKIVGMGSGLSISALGPTHHTTEDIAILRALPNLMILSPATPLQVQQCVEQAYLHKGPVYIRIEMNNEKEFFEKESFNVSQNQLLREKGDITVFSTGSILEEVMEAAIRLEEDEIKVNVVNVSLIKPFDRSNLVKMAQMSRMVVTVEEHNIIGGLGGIISEILVEEGIAVRLLKIGLEDMFAVGFGTLKQIRKENGLSSENIYQKIKEKVNE